jgi:hypothetical protein
MQGDKTPLVATTAQQAEAVASLEALNRAAADPLPGPALGAFLPRREIVGPFEVRRLVPSDLSILQALDHPIIAEARENAQPNKKGLPVNWTYDDAWVLIWMFTNEPKKGREIYRQGGKAGYIENAIAEVADRDDVTPELLGQVLRAVIAQVQRSAETAQRMEAAETHDDEKKSPKTPEK